MNEERLYINGQELKLKPSAPLAYTLQVNDISGVANRQASFTRTISIPKCPENNIAMNFLGVAGNQSISPYIKNKINYYVGNDCVIYEGWGVISETTDDDYKLNIYDGVIDLFKAIENKTLDQLNLTEINHDKSLSGVTYTWNNDLNYKYILADYNGKLKYSGDTINIDYLVPSVKVSYLWDKTFSNYGMTYEGSVFSGADFQNLWMTYPKGTFTLLPEVGFFESSDINFSTNAGADSKRRFITYNTFSTSSGTTVINNVHVQVPVDGNYRIKISGNFKYRSNPSTVKCYTKLHIAYNKQPTTNPDTVGLGASTELSSFQNYGTAFDYNFIKPLTAGETFCLIVQGNAPLVSDDGSELSIEVTKIDNLAIDFNEALSQFKVTDFLKEILWRYSLTIFKDKYTNNYKFLTLDERIATADKVDWSDKFQRVKSEKYIYGDYAQKNNLKHKYNDENSNYNDGSIFVLNENLDDEKNIIESKIYTPEKELNATELPFQSHVYKLWNKEINENEGVQEVEYKVLDKRFYFLKAQDYTFSSPVTIGSEALIQATTATTAPIESYSGVSYNEVVTNYYGQIGNIISTANITTAEFNLTSTDIATFDFKKQYYIEQLGSYYLVNKINNWTPNKLVEVELIKIDNDLPRPDLTPPTTEELYITITGQTITNADAWTRIINIFFETNITTPYLQAVINDGSPVTILNSSPYSLLDIINPLGGTTTLKLQSMDGTVISNTTSWWG
ncbi:hypothetical protein B0I03_10550 [Flavobacterium aquaticum]|uniref:Uncharacterized protein n=1 Tax=Flavobacterium aquaticum TaxID=1236486 RepID=A0A327YKT1_9FLAO|nr:hypothetical protein [Flavobacterium aquaticum]RAK21618.1 hypothetical protein B0I03_10550 [Flavobacterium aquaticum]